MSFTEIRQEAAQLSAVERQKLICFLAELSEGENDSYYGDMDRRMKAMDEGKRVTQEDLEAGHRDLLRQGR